MRRRRRRRRDPREHHADLGIRRGWHVSFERELPDFILLDVVLTNGPEDGADSVLTKPIEQPEFLALVRLLLPVHTLSAHLAAMNLLLEQRVPLRAVGGTVSPGAVGGTSESSRYVMLRTGPLCCLRAWIEEG